jgi:arylsulfatase A-like enzyme
VCNVDFYPTFARAASMPVEQDVDGVSLVPVLRNARAKLDRDTLYWHYPLKKPHFLSGRSAGAIRKGDWKLIEFFDLGKVELYDLAGDPGEQHDLAQEKPDKKQELLKALHDWQRRVGARWPEGQPKRL